VDFTAVTDEVYWLYREGKYPDPAHIEAYADRARSAWLRTMA
jgi:hypothetical protein